MIYRFKKSSSEKFRKQIIFATVRRDCASGRGRRFGGSVCGLGCGGRGGRGQGYQSGYSDCEGGNGTFENGIVTYDTTR